MPAASKARCSNPSCRRLHAGRGRCRDCRNVKDRQIHSSNPWRWVYNDPRWHRLRDQVLSEEPICRTAGCQEPSTVVDHMVQHRGDADLAFDRANCQALCKRHHDEKTARETLNGSGRR